ncbi:hypothetical protein [Caballeronia sp. LZ016]|uniref:hypothetical protein n=1 Tax=Caballeronia sp. LZ016 TaxID=3038554 RepID=UPI00285F760D|nr:hypothetical protein [Caballeronia sp. LZ016]MDR5737595.1 hypothetical protein [Caballeronia sp. LZ016]
MSKNKLLIAITAGLFTATAATGAFAQTSSGNSSAAMGGDTSTATQGDASAGTGSTGTTTKKHHKARKHGTQSSAATKKTPEAETGNNSATESGQSK